MAKCKRRFEWCDDCHHQPLDHQKGGCYGHDEWGKCNCKKFVASKEVYEINT